MASISIFSLMHPFIYYRKVQRPGSYTDFVELSPAFKPASVKINNKKGYYFPWSKNCSLAKYQEIRYTNLSRRAKLIEQMNCGILIN